MNDTKVIDDRATNLLTSVFGSISAVKLPIDLNEIARYCNLTVQQGDFENKDLEGALDRSKRTIYLSEKDTFDRKNFTLAHELGHFKLHEDINTELFFMHQLTHLLTPTEDEKEGAADWFAASLLIPEQLLKSLWEVNKDIESLSNIFGVPKVVMRYRIDNLNLKTT